jgi:uncharacterized protein DUF6946
MSFSLVSRTGKPITTVDEWRDELNKREQSKFVPGYSAYESARAWTEPNRIPAAIKALFRLPPLEGFRLERAVVEQKTWFDKYGGPRHHDLLLTARNAAGRVAVIGVESKVNEDFGGTLRGEHAAAVRKSVRDGYESKFPARLHDLSVALLGRDLAADNPFDPRDAELRYQLLSALAGTLVEADLARADVAMLLVHEFQTRFTKAAVEQRSSRRIQALLERFGREAAAELTLGQPIGPFKVGGGGAIPPGKTFYVAKVRSVVASPASGPDDARQ